MPLLFEPVEHYKRGVHHAIEIDPARVQTLREPLDMARTYAQVGPLVAWIKAHVDHTLIEEDTFFEADDGYPTAPYLKSALIEALQVDGAKDFGLGIHGAIHDAEMAYGTPPFDGTGAVSPEWLEAGPEVDFLVASAESLFRSLNFHPVIDEDAISDVTDTYDQGGLTMDVASGDFLSGVDVLEEWKRTLAIKLADFYDTLEEMAKRGAWVATWYEN